MAAVACTLAVLAAACIDLEMDLVVRDDGSGSVEATMSIHTAMLGFAALGEGELSETTEEMCQQFAGEMGAGGPSIFGLDELDDFDISVGDGTCTVRFGRTWDAADFDTVMAVLAEDGGPSVHRTVGGGWRFELDLAPLSSDLSEDGLSEDELAQAAALGFELPTLAISVTLPGETVEHNADSVRQSQFAWELDFLATDELPESLYAETAPGDGLSPAAIGAIVAGVLLALAALVTLRRHQEAKAAASSADDVESTGAIAIDSTDDAGSTEM